MKWQEVPSERYQARSLHAKEVEKEGPRAEKGLGTSTEFKREKGVDTKFEALIIRELLENTMSAHNSLLFGRGMSGSVWKSLFVDKVADEIARSGKLGMMVHRVDLRSIA